MEAKVSKVLVELPDADIEKLDDLKDALGVASRAKVISILLRDMSQKAVAQPARVVVGRKSAAVLQQPVRA